MPGSGWVKSELQLPCLCHTPSVEGVFFYLPLATFFGFEALETESGFAIALRNCGWDTPCCCTRLIGQTARLPVGFTPVRVIQIRDNDTLAGRGMEKLAIADEDTDMLAPTTGVEK